MGSLFYHGAARRLALGVENSKLDAAAPPEREGDDVDLRSPGLVGVADAVLAKDRADERVDSLLEGAIALFLRRPHVDVAERAAGVAQHEMKQQTVERPGAELGDDRLVELATLWREVADRRASNMRLLAEELVATGEVRPELAARRIADILWTLSSPELHDLLVQGRGWSPDELGAWLAEGWSRLLLRPTSAKLKGRG